jgi:hypothetical protein
MDAVDTAAAPTAPADLRADLVRRGLIIERQDGDRKVNITTIDCMRLLADKTGERDGEGDPEWCGPDGKWKKTWVAEGPPVAARVRVYRKGHAKPYVGVAHYAMYVQATSFWVRGSAFMTAKCAEALALRKGWPAELASIYATEEMDQASNAPTPTDVAIDTKLYLTAIAAASDLAAIEKLGRQLAKTIPQDHPAYAELGEAFEAKRCELDRGPEAA